MEIVIIAILIAFSAIFSSTETAFSSVNKIRMKNLAAPGNKKAALVMKIKDSFDKALTAVLVGNNIVNIGDVEYAILETSGQITVIQKPNKRTTIPEDFGIEPEYEGIAYDLVVDGKVMYENLKILKKDYDWLKKQVNKFGILPEQALLVTIDGKGNFFCQKKEEKWL